MLKIDKYSYGSPKILWGDNNQDKNQCIIGKFCSIAENITIYLGGNHNTNWITTYPFGHIYTHKFNSFNGVGHPKSKGNVIIENDVWIGDNVIIMSGVQIGNGAVIANNSHIVKDVEPYSIVGGNPAKLIKYRFTKEQIEKLEKIRWWDWDDEKINNNLHLLCSNNIDDFINSTS